MHALAVRSIDFADQLSAEEKVVNIATKKQEARQGQMESEDDNYIKALQSMAKVRTKGGWDAQREYLLKNRISEGQSESFDALVAMEYSPEAKARLKDYLGDQKQLPKDYQAARDTGFEGSYLDFVGEKADVARSEKEKKKDITPSQALANLRALATAVKERQYEEQFEGMNQEQISQVIANEWEWDLEKFREVAGGNQEQPPQTGLAVTTAPAHGPSLPPASAETRELEDGTVWEKTSGGWKRIK